MHENQRKKWNAEKLAELYPPFGDKIGAILIELESFGFRPRIQEAWRSEADQLKAFNSGHSQLKFGFHNVTGANGRKESLAIDLVDDDIINNRKTKYSSAEFLLRLEAATRRQGLMTGISFGLEKFQGAMELIEAAISNGDFLAPIKHFGWDPGHIQPRDMTAIDAKKGKRPF
jgi:hypothetical protein